ncbi:bifunctional diguanylate cyclase/phosphodiesterase [Salinicola acroporae]|uniref:GGDEF domain-containing protein n=1 Tax=Salinicola acroporae TaxID=1541440 RepID=A0ABT6I9V2_9GAMM|nr:EAL domain-containing protein [Salinicola acroporae]MDH4574386.1 GGDEF domain-containing protein [Salinicola acroporae]
MHNRKNVFRISLKWRALVFTSFLLLALASLVAWVSNHALVQQFSQSQKSFYDRQRYEVSLTLQSSADAMRQIASLLASSPSLSHALLEGDASDIESALSPQWPTLQLDAGLDDVSVYDSDTKSVITLGQGQPDSQAAVDAEWLGQVIKEEKPMKRLACYRECRQYVAVPVLAEGMDAGVIMVSRSLADVTRYMQRSSGSEVALLVTASGLTRFANDRFLESWNANLIALTHEDTSWPLLKSIAGGITFSEVDGKVARYTEDNKVFEVIAIPIDKDNQQVGEKSGYFLLVSDVTAQINSISSTTRMVLLIALLGWLASEVILFSMLKNRMDRLRIISRKLPLLAQRRYDVMRDSMPPTKAFFLDELDVLEGTAIELETKLEGMEQEINLRGVELENRVKELARERDFVSGLFNTAQVLIVIHNRNGHITLTNRFCEWLTGQSSDQLSDNKFQDVFAADLVNIDEFFDGGGQQESKLVSGDGEIRTIVWYHTPLETEDRGSHQELISVGVDITERKLAETRLLWLASRDSLTELYNRRFFEEALSRAVTPSSFGAVLYLDLDRFKEVNETSGHQSGDQLLRSVAAALSELGRGNVVARLGGDEFAILLEHASQQSAVDMAQRIADHLEQKTLHVEGRIHRASASIGIALYPANGAFPDELMANADYAMYQAKVDAAQRWYLLSPEQQGREEIKQRVYWVEMIRNALLNDDFELMVQPIFRLFDFDVQHYEVLLRLRDANGENLSPGIFIPVAEQSGQIVAVDKWVLSNGIRLMSTLADTTANLAINLSGQSLHDGDLTDFMKHEFSRHAVDPARIIIEVTETAAVTDFASARCVLESIRALGCKVALDDFGVGFSSFHYLGQFPADYIKIDGSFIQKLPESEESQLIVKAIVDIAKGMGKKTVAEFVDRSELLPYLRGYGVDYVQGFYLGRPTTIADAEFYKG